MKKLLYYVIEKELHDDGETLTGNKTITLYDMVDNKPKMFGLIDTTNDTNSLKEIQLYLNDNGHGDETFEFKQL